VFLHPVRYVGHIVHCVLSGARNIDKLFFMLEWDRFEFQKMCTKRRDTLRQTCVLLPVGSAGHLVHCIVSGTHNFDSLFFMVGWDWYGFHKKRLVLSNLCFCIRYGFQKKHDGTRYTELAFLHPMGSTGHVVQCVASGARNVDALFCMLGWDEYKFHKKLKGTR
jgi:hypothetical protein